MAVSRTSAAAEAGQRRSGARVQAVANEIIAFRDDVCGAD